MGKILSDKLRNSTKPLIIIILRCTTVIFGILTIRNEDITRLEQDSFTNSSPSAPILLYSEAALVAYPGKSGNGSF
jgi:hypothetical protein